MKLTSPFFVSSALPKPCLSRSSRRLLSPFVRLFGLDGRTDENNTPANHSARQYLCRSFALPLSSLCELLSAALVHSVTKDNVKSYVVTNVKIYFNICWHRRFYNVRALCNFAKESDLQCDDIGTAKELCDVPCRVEPVMVDYFVVWLCCYVVECWYIIEFLNFIEQWRPIEK